MCGDAHAIIWVVGIYVAVVFLLYLDTRPKKGEYRYPDIYD